MHVSILTIFPELFDSFVETSLIGRAMVSGRLSIDVHDLRDFTTDPHRVVDDEPYGGGAGMVMKAEPWIRAVRQIAGDRAHRAHRVLLSPRGSRLDEEKVRELAGHSALTLLCGRYEGLDERVRRTVVDEEISIGDYVLSGGEVPAMVLVEAISRQLPGVVGQIESVERDSFRDGLLDYPHFTRPNQVDGLEVPEVLRSGDHRAIALWRRREALRETLRRRPELLASAALSPIDRAAVAEIAAEEGLELPPGRW